MSLRRMLGLPKSAPKPIKRVRARVYPFTPSARPYASTRAGRALIAIMRSGDEGFVAFCRAMAEDAPRHAAIRQLEQTDRLPKWRNHYMPPLDGMSLYTLLRLRRPKTYMEIGSGTSTKFARKAIEEHGLPTRIVSIDPNPRAEIDALCDEVIRAPFQTIGEAILDRLEPGDVLFQDGSHHVFTNTDATVFFCEVLPCLPKGLVYGIHDIFLPDDYPDGWHKRFYNEQYLFAAYLLAGGPDRILFPSHYAARDLGAEIEPIFASLPELAGLRPGGGVVWMEKG